MRFRSAFMTIAVFAASLAMAEDNLDEFKTIEKIELLGGSIERDETLPDRPVIGIRFSTKSRFNDKYVYLLKKFENLKTLDLIDATMTDIGINTLGQLTSLNELQLSGPEITDQSVNELCKLVNLSQLTLCGTEMTSAGQKILHESLPTLVISNEKAFYKRVVNIGGTVDNIRVGNKIETFRLKFDESRVTDDQLREVLPLRGVRTLTDLWFKDCRNITDAGIKELVSFRTMSNLTIQDCPQITSKSLTSFKNHQGLTCLYFAQSEQHQGIRLTDDGMKDIAELKNLTRLQIFGDHQITDKGIVELKELKNLEFLELGETRISGRGLSALQALPKLTNLYLYDGEEISDAAVKELGELNNLKCLHLNETSITDVGLREIGRMTALVELNINGNQITDAGLKELQNLKNLRILDIRNIEEITDAGLKELAELKTLEQLSVSGCEVTDEGCDELQKQLPNVDIER